MFHDPHNTFRAADAFEYTDVYRQAVKQTPAEIRQRLLDLNERIKRVKQHYHFDSYRLMIVGYRALEDALQFVEEKIVPGTVKIDDTDPTPMLRMTPQGYVPC